MLRFIVLGQIPGTQIQLNFLPLVLLGLIALLIFEMFLNNRRKQILATAAAVSAPAPVKKTQRKTTRKPTQKTAKKSPAKRKTSKAKKAKLTKKH